MATGRIGVTPTLGTRWSKAPAGGTTSLSGLDDNSVSLVYSVGYEQVYRNGVLLSRGNDYTATTGNSITLIDATIAGDIIEVFANQLVPLTDAISKGQFTAKGALLSATAASTPGVLTVGSNNQVLTADSTTATGLKWATPSAPSFVGAMLFSAADQTISNNTFTAVQFAATDYIDTDNFHNPSTNNSRMTIPSGKAGKYLVIAGALFGADTTVFRGSFYLNGSNFSEWRFRTNDRDTAIQYAIMDLAVGDYVEFYVYQLSGGNVDIWGTTSLGGVRATRFGIQYLGA